MRVRDIPGLLKATFWRWWGENTFQLGAALAYYTALSMAPLVLIALAVTGMVFDQATAPKRLLAEIQDTFGPNVAEAIAAIVRSAQESGNGGLATAIGVAMLLFGATSVFAQLQESLNTIWGVRAKEGVSWWVAVKDRFWTFTVVLGIGFLLLVSLLLTAALTALTTFVTPAALPGGTYLWQAVNQAASFAVVTLLFALIYKLLPDVHIAWEDVWVGSAVTALLFAVGKYLIGLYLGQNSLISAYGAAGSLVVILLWVYYSSQIFLFGAEFTYVFAHRAGKPLIPKENAEPLTAEARARQGLGRPAPVAAG